MYILHFFFTFSVSLLSFAKVCLHEEEKCNELTIEAFCQLQLGVCVLF